MNLKKLKYSILPFFLTATLFSETYTIEKILTIVESSSDDIAISEIEYKIAGEDVKMSRSEAFPQINFNTGVGYGGTSMEPTKYQSPASLQNPLGYISHLNGTTLNWGVTVNQPLITFGKVKSALKIAEIYKQQRKDSRVMKQEIFYLSVIQAFITAYNAQADVAIAKDAVAYDNRFLEKLRIDLELGTALPRDTLTVFAKLSSSKSTLIGAKLTHKTAIRKLAKLTELDIVPTSFLEYDETGYLSKISKSDKVKSVELLLKESEVAMRKEQISYEKSKLFPSIYLNAGLNNQFMIPNISQAESDILGNDDFKSALPDGSNSSDALKPLIDNLEENVPGILDYFNPKYMNYSIGLQLTWNIFDGYRTKANYNKTKFIYEKSKLELKKLEDEKSIAIVEAEDIYTSLEETQESVIAQRDALMQAFSSITDDYSDGYTDFLSFSDMERNIAIATKNIYALNMQKILAVTQYRISSGISLQKEGK